ncbi:MAG: lactonase family protein, partial [Candidatus Hydrogenedentota bacterium]
MARHYSIFTALITFTMTFSANAADTAATANQSSWRVYIGTYTRGASEGIYLLDFDPQTGRLGEPKLAAEIENPSFLALHPTKPLLYAVGVTTRANGEKWDAVTAFVIDPGTGMLTQLNRESSMGSGPCHVSVHPAGRHVAVANYGGGSIAVLPIREDGALGAASAFVQHEGSSVHPRQKQPHAHSVNFDPAGRFLFAADLGLDKIMVCRFNKAQGTLESNEPPHAQVAPGAGPRHFAFHPSGNYAYVINELDSTITAFTYDG